MKTPRDNFRVIWRQYSSWVVTAAAAGAVKWLSMPAAEQAQMLAALPFTPAAVPVVTFALWVVAKTVVQRSLAALAAAEPPMPAAPTAAEERP